MVERPDSPEILAVKSDSFFMCKSGPIHEISLIWALFESFLPSARVSYEGHLLSQKRMMSQMVEGQWFQRVVSGFEVISLVNNFGVRGFRL